MGDYLNKNARYAPISGLKNIVMGDYRHSDFFTVPIMFQDNKKIITLHFGKE